METIADKLDRARDRLEQAAQDANRAPNCVQLLAVSKTKPVSDISLAYAAGQRSFGENYVQEGVEKIQALSQHKDISWHFIGPLQSNKTRPVASHFDWVQSVDRAKIAQRLNDQRSPHKPPLNICLQVNIDNEASKSGLVASDVLPLAELVAGLPRLALRGLMAIPLATDDPERQRQSFQQMHALYSMLRQRFDSVDTLSMGMSGDLEVAVAEGATMVRLGTAIFGARQQREQ